MEILRRGTIGNYTATRHREHRGETLSPSRLDRYVSARDGASQGGKHHEMPAHHLLETYIDAYVTAAGIGADKTLPLFRTLGGAAVSSSA